MTQQILKHSILQEIKANLALSAPLMAAWLIYSLGPFAGTVMIAHLGKDVLAASILVGTIWIAGVTFCFGVFHSVSVLISQQFGAKNFEAISEVMGQAFLLDLISWIPMSLLMLSIPYLIHWSAPNAEILKYGTQYAHAMLLAAPGLITLVILEHFLSGIGKTQLSLWISLVEVPVEIFFIYVFVYGKFGVPAFGIAGVGYGLAISYTFTTIIVFSYLYFARFAQPFQIYKHVGEFNFRYCKEMLRIGAPVGFMYFIELTAFTIATYFISRFNATALAAHQIIMQFEAVVVNIPFAISQAISVRVGLNVGRQDKTGVYFASYVGLGVGFIASLLVFLIFVLFPENLLQIDLNKESAHDTGLISLTVSLFFVLGVYQIIDSMRILVSGALRGVKDTHFTMVVNLVCFILIAVMAAYLFGIYWNGNVQGVWWGLALGILVSAGVLLWRLWEILKQADLAEILKISHE